MIHLEFVLPCVTFLVIVWALDPLGVSVIVFNEGIGVDFASTFFESGLALLKVGCVMFGANDGDEDDESGYDTDEDTLDLRRVEITSFWVLLERKG